MKCLVIDANFQDYNKRKTFYLIYYLILNL